MLVDVGRCSSNIGPFTRRHENVGDRLDLMSVGYHCQRFTRWGEVIPKILAQKFIITFEELVRLILSFHRSISHGYSSHHDSHKHYFRVSAGGGWPVAIVVASFPTVVLPDSRHPLVLVYQS